MSALARQIHDGGALKDKFDTIVQEDEELLGDKRALDRRVTTRWNTDFLCMEAHRHFRGPIELLTGNNLNKLQAYHLSDDHWNLTDTLHDVLMVSLSI